MIKTKKQMLIVIGLFSLVLLLGEVTYAFFNYSRTGSSSSIKFENFDETNAGTSTNPYRILGANN